MVGSGAGGIMAQCKELKARYVYHFLEAAVICEYIERDRTLTCCSGLEREDCEKSPAACAGARKCGLSP